MEQLHPGTIIPPTSVRGKIVFQETDPWSQKGWGPCHKNTREDHSPRRRRHFRMTGGIYLNLQPPFAGFMPGTRQVAPAGRKGILIQAPREGLGSCIGRNSRQAADCSERRAFPESCSTSEEGVLRQRAEECPISVLSFCFFFFLGVLSM